MPSYEVPRKTGDAWDAMQRSEAEEYSKKQLLDLRRDVEKLEAKIASKTHTSEDLIALEENQKRIARHEHTLEIAAERRKSAGR